MGHSDQGTFPGKSAERLSIEAITAALADAGITREQVDGLITCKSIQGGNADVSVGPLFGMSPKYAQTLDYGTCNFSLHLAVQAILTGLAETIVLVYGANARSSKVNFAAPTPSLEGASGFVHIAGQAGMALQRHKALYGTTDEEFGWFAVSEREWAQRNPLAIFRDPLTIEDYLAKPYLVEPLRREDVTMISDGGVALIVTSAERAKDYPNKPVYILGMAEGTEIIGDRFADFPSRPNIGGTAARIWQNTGFTPSDIDILYIQNPTAVWNLQMVEYYGFAPVGEGGRWVAEGHTRPGGDMPLNTNGGQLSESYMWGWLHMVEAVRQLRGTVDPDRQVPHPELALYCSTMAFFKSAASIIGTSQ
ncbi:thiolase [Streptomyces capitiformicae]|uniref:Thiolase n=1 Tax=Streptomyces capitiformicae TaxID=2014920 RepID=A0A918ZCY2_9ACTN|nr:thiolase [Streptomyces capitiformicae]